MSQSRRWAIDEGVAWELISTLNTLFMHIEASGQETPVPNRVQTAAVELLGQLLGSVRDSDVKLIGLYGWCYYCGAINDREREILWRVKLLDAQRVLAESDNLPEHTWDEVISTAGVLAALQVDCGRAEDARQTLEHLAGLSRAHAFDVDISGIRAELGL
jgi:hypothetical protein